VSIGTFYFLAKVCNTDVKNPWGKKNDDNQWAYGHPSTTQFLMNAIRFCKSSNQLANDFNDGYAFLDQLSGTKFVNKLVYILSKSDDINTNPFIAFCIFYSDKLIISSNLLNLSNSCFKNVAIEFNIPVGPITNVDSPASSNEITSGNFFNNSFANWITVSSGVFVSSDSSLGSIGWIDSNTDNITFDSLYWNVILALECIPNISGRSTNDKLST